jgi:hypothetical protein
MHPVATLAGLAASLGVGKGTEAAANYIGLKPGYSQLLSDIAAARTGVGLGNVAKNAAKPSLSEIPTSRFGLLKLFLKQMMPGAASTENSTAPPTPKAPFTADDEIALRKFAENQARESMARAAAERSTRIPTSPTLPPISQPVPGRTSLLPGESGPAVPQTPLQATQVQSQPPASVPLDTQYMINAQRAIDAFTNANRGLPESGTVNQTALNAVRNPGQATPPVVKNLSPQNQWEMVVQMLQALQNIKK